MDEISVVWGRCPATGMLTRFRQMALSAWRKAAIHVHIELTRSRSLALSVHLYVWHNDILEKPLNVLRISLWKANAPGEDDD